MSLDEIIQKYMPSEQSVRNMEEFFAVFSQATRLRLIALLSVSPLAVNDIARILRLNQTTVSHQLRILKDRKIVSTLRNGKEIIYSLANEGVNDILYQALKLTETKDCCYADRLRKDGTIGW